MTIRYQNTFRDIVAFCFYHYPRSPLVAGAYAVGFAVISVAISMLCQSLPQNVSVTGRIIAFFVLDFIAFGLLVAMFSLSVVLGVISRRNKTILTGHTITLGEDGFTTETWYDRSESKWSLVQNLARTRGYIFIYVAQHAAHVIPRRAFQDAGEWNSFYEFCKQKTKAAQTRAKSAG